MKIRELIRHVLAGKELNALERAELERFDPESAQGELDTLRRQLEEAADAKLSAEDLLRKQLDAAARERDQLRSDRDRLKRGVRIREIADRSGCRDAGYLDYLAGTRGVDLDDDGAVRNFIAGMTEENPHCFHVPLQPGTGAGTPVQTPSAAPADAGCDRIGRIIESLDGAPDAR